MTQAPFRLTNAQDKAMDVLGSGATHVALGGGSRSGKTFLLVRTVIIRAARASNSRHAIFRFRFNSVKSSVILDTLPKVLRLCFPGALPPISEALNKTDWYYTLPNGSEIWFGGLDDKERTEKILGMEFATIYFNECSQIPWASVVLALTRLAQKNENIELRALYDFNPPSKKHWTYQLFIDKRNPEDRQPVPEPMAYAYYMINPHDNADNLDKGYIAMLESLPEKARNRFLWGRFGDDSEGALWTEELLAQNRILGQSGELPDWLRIIVAVDPSGTKGAEDERSDEVGIVVAALGTDSHGYLLEDLSGRYSPEEWGQIAVQAYHRHKADRIVGESNYGGDMVRAIVQAQDRNVPYAEVRASRGKVVRAEPISHLYEQQRIHHVGYFPELEEQMCNMLQSGYVGLKSPDRCDSLVWAMTELFPGMTRRADANEAMPVVSAPARAASRYQGEFRASGRDRRL